MNKRDLVIVALATFCLTATLFMILPSRSAERDPWADVSGPIQGEPDGTINMRDINYEIQHFNQDVSNMTRNVNVTNWPTMQPEPAYRIIESPVYNMSWTGGNGWLFPDRIYVGGFGKAFVMIEAAGPPYNVSAGNYIVSIRSESVYWYLESQKMWGASQNLGPYKGPQSPVSEIDVINSQYAGGTTPQWSEDSYLGVKAPYMQLQLSCNATVSTGWLNIQVTVYLRNE